MLILVIEINMGGIMYKFAIEGKGVLKKFSKISDALNALKECGKDGAVVIYDGRLIAFYCGYSNKVKAGFGAFDWERSEIGN